MGPPLTTAFQRPLSPRGQPGGLGALSPAQDGWEPTRGGSPSQDGHSVATVQGGERGPGWGSSHQLLSAQHPAQAPTVLSPSRELGKGSLTFSGRVEQQKALHKQGLQEGPCSQLAFRAPFSSPTHSCLPFSPIRRPGPAAACSEWVIVSAPSAPQPLPFPLSPRFPGGSPKKPISVPIFQK